MKLASVPQRVLSEALTETIGDRTVTAAVFVSYQFEPGFFEDQVLPPLLGCETGHGDRVQRALLETRLREIDEVLVFYDRSGLIVDRTPRQAVATVPVTWGYKVLHAKHVLLLVRGVPDDGAPSTDALIVVTTSANLTRSGWWENVEVADVEELPQGGSSPLQPDLVRLLAVLRQLDPDSEHPALDAIERFVHDIDAAPGLPRLWTGDEPLVEFLAARLAGTRVGRVEVFAPYVSEEAGPIRDLQRALRPGELRVRLPTDRDDAPAATETWRDAVAALEGARFADLPGGVDRSLGRGSTSRRFVHAKVVRIVSADGARAWTLAGSPNLTEAAFLGRAKGNFETAILREAPTAPDWLRPLEATPRGATEPVHPPEEGRPWTLIRLRLRFDWKDGSASYRLEERAGSDLHLGRAGHGAGVAITFHAEPTDGWRALPDPVAAWLRAELPSSNVVRVHVDGAEPMPLLVEEVGCLSRPDFLYQALTPADILRYWSLRDPTSREAHLEQVLARLAGGVEGVTRPAPVLEGARTMFDSFAGLFHAFLCSREWLDEQLDLGRERAAVARLLGKGHDALPTLLEKVLGDPEPDRVQQLLTLLSAREVLEHVRRRRPRLFDAFPDELAALEAQLDRVGEVWDQLRLDAGGSDPIDPREFRDWYTAHWPSTVVTR